MQVGFLKVVGVVAMGILAAVGAWYIKRPVCLTGCSFRMMYIGEAPNKYLFPFFTSAQSSSLVVDPKRVELVVVVQHGIRENGHEYCSAIGDACTVLGIGPERVLIIAPLFSSDGFLINQKRYRKLAETFSLPIWQAGEWEKGGCSQKGHRVSSFTVYDDLLKSILHNGPFPCLKKIVFIGHSAGAQTVQRYALLNDFHEECDRLGVTITYVVANPSSYLYLTDERPNAEGFVPYEIATCSGFNTYKYGLEDIDLLCYRSKLSHDPEKLFCRFAQRPVHYVLGEQDTNPQDRYLDKKCPAKAQGRTRYQRGILYQAYEQHLAKKWNTTLNHSLCQVPGVGHDYKAIFLSECVKNVLTI